MSAKIVQTMNAAGSTATRGLCVKIGPHGTTTTIPLATLQTTAKGIVDGVVDAGLAPSAADDPINVCLKGICKAYAGAAFAIGDKLRCDTAGKVVKSHNTTTFGSGATELIVESQKPYDGDIGKLISVTLTDPGGATQSLAITVAGLDIDVSLATDGGSAITSTPAEIAAALAADADASLLVYSDSDGASAVLAATIQYLTGGGGDFAVALQKAAAANEFVDILVGKE